MTYDGVIEKPELDELYHYGVQGMKWGVRKSASRDGSGGKIPHKKYSTLKPSKRKPVKTLRNSGFNRKNEEYFNKLSTETLKTMLNSVDADSNDETKQIINRIIEERKKPKENK